MQDNNHEMLKRVLEDRPPAAGRNQELRERLARWFEGRRNVVLAWATLYMLASAGLIVAGLRLLTTAWDTRIMLAGVVLLAAGFSLNVVIKLWYWIVDSKLALARDLKELRLALHRSEVPAAAPGVQEELASLLPDEFAHQLRTRRLSLWERLHHRTAQRLARCVVIVGGVAAGIAIGLSLGNRPETPRVEQTDEWRFEKEGMVRVRSELSLARSPEEGRYVTICLPLSAGDVMAVSHAGRSLPFTRVDWRRFEIELPVLLPDPGAGPLVVEWRFPLARLDQTPEGYRTPLAGLVAVHRYRLSVAVDPAEGYEAIGQPDAQQIAPFSGTAGRATWQFGSCIVPVRPAARIEPAAAEAKL